MPSKRKMPAGLRKFQACMRAVKKSKTYKQAVAFCKAKGRKIKRKTKRKPRK